MTKRGVIVAVVEHDGLVRPGAIGWRMNTTAPAEA